MNEIVNYLNFYTENYNNNQQQTQMFYPNHYNPHQSHKNRAHNSLTYHPYPNYNQRQYQQNHQPIQQQQQQKVFPKPVYSYR